MLRKEFSEFGHVLDARIVMDRESGRSRGFGFVTFAQGSEAEEAKAKMNNRLLDGRYIRVDLASNRPPSSPSSSSSSSTPSSIAGSSLSGFSFSSARPSRPPVVEDWGPLLSYGSSSSASASASASASSSSSSSPSLQKSPPVAPASSYGYGGSSPGGLGQGNGIDSTTKPSSEGSSHAGPISAMAAASEAEIGIEVKGGEANRMLESNASVASQSQQVWPRIKETGTASSASSSSSSLSLSSASGSDPRPRSRRHALTNELLECAGMEDPSSTYKPKLTMDAIPGFKGTPYDFGLSSSDMLSSLPSPAKEESGSAAGSKPRVGGGFDIALSFDNVKEEEDPDSLPGYSIFSQRTLPPLDLPWGTPEADNWSEIGKEPRRIEDSPYSPFSSDLKDDPEFWWDPYDFDPEAKVFKEQESTEQAPDKEAEAELSLDKLFAKEMGAKDSSLSSSTSGDLGAETQPLNAASMR
jgi:hypothetical protein